MYVHVSVVARYGHINYVHAETTPGRCAPVVPCVPATCILPDSRWHNLDVGRSVFFLLQRQMLAPEKVRR